MAKLEFLPEFFVTKLASIVSARMSKFLYPLAWTSLLRKSGSIFFLGLALLLALVTYWL